MLVPTSPFTPVLTRDEVKTHLGVDHSDHDAMIDGMIVAQMAAIERRFGGAGRAIFPRSYEWRLAGTEQWFPYSWGSLRPWWRYGAGDRFALPLAPLISVESVTYRDANGVNQTIDASVYEKWGLGTLDPGGIVLSEGQVWPVTDAGWDALTVSFTAGFPADSDDMKNIKQGLKMRLTSAYARRVDPEPVDARWDEAIDDILGDYRVPRL